MSDIQSNPVDAAAAAAVGTAAADAVQVVDHGADHAEAEVAKKSVGLVARAEALVGHLVTGVEHLTEEAIEKLRTGIDDLLAHFEPKASTDSAEDQAAAAAAIDAVDKH